MIFKLNNLSLIFLKIKLIKYRVIIYFNIKQIYLNQK